MDAKLTYQNLLLSLIAISLISAIISCSSGNSTPVNVDPLANKGIGPITSLTLEALNKEQIKKGKDIFEAICVSCHKIEDKFVGPALYGITKRRTPEWIANMILNTDEMLKNDPIARDLLTEYKVPMTNQNLNKSEALAILEYFRDFDK